jgi:hypothetical protein
MSNAALKKPLAIAALFLVTIAVAGVSLEIGRRIGYRSGLRVAGRETATRLRADVEAASGTPSTGLSIQGVDVDSSEGSVHVHYKTRKPLGDCRGQQVEMNEVWKLVVAPRVHASPVRTVVLWPEETLGRSASFQFAPDRSKEWRAQAPCSIRISP